jgi:carbonic anhydrase
MDLIRTIRFLSRLLFLVTLSLASLAQTASSAKPAKSNAECAENPFAYDNGPVGQQTWCGVCNDAALRHFQAPINIPEGTPDPALPAIKFTGYDQPTLPLKTTLHNPYNLKIYTPAGSNSIEIPPLGKYTLDEFHFHRPSEEAVNNHRYPMVIHFVHKKAGCTTGQCAVVIGVLVEEGQPAEKTSAALKVLFQRFPPPASTGGPPIELQGLLPDDYQSAGYYTYIGSLTTPPCSENITFYILKTPVKFSAAELKEFARRYPSPNARDIQDLNSRPVRNR